MRWEISSPFAVTYLSWHGVPELLWLKQSSAMPEKPMSLPPIVIVTSVVVGVRRSNCGGLGCGDTPRGAGMSSVSAPEQGAAREGDAPSWMLARRAELLVDLRQPKGGIGAGMSGPAAYESPSATISSAAFAVAADMAVNSAATSSASSPLRITSPSPHIPGPAPQPAGR